MRLLPKSIHWCRRYPTKFNSGRDIPNDSPVSVKKNRVLPLKAIITTAHSCGRRPTAVDEPFDGRIGVTA